MINEYDKGAVRRISTVLGHFYHVPCRRVVWNRTFRTFIWPNIRSVIWETKNLWGSSFFTKYLKFIAHFKNAAKKSEKLFCFWDNCIWIGIVKLSLLRTGSLSLAANVLTSNHKIWHAINRDFFQLNWLGSDESVA